MTPLISTLFALMAFSTVSIPTSEPKGPYSANLRAKIGVVEAQPVQAVDASTEYVQKKPENVQVESIEDIISRVGREEGLSQKEIERFKRIAWCESRYNPMAVSKSNDHGLLQLNARYWKFDPVKVYEPEYNVRYAIQNVYKKQGINAWVCNKLIN